MNKNIVFLVVILISGILIGVFLGPSKEVNFKTIATNPDEETYQDINVSEATPNQNIEQLQKRITTLEFQVSQIIENLESEDNEEDSISSGEAQTAPSRKFKGLSEDVLLEAGVNEALAADIMRRKGENDFKRLDLRDRATREGYLNTQRYREELNAINANQVSIREEIGDEAYDRYLYAAGRNNRVKVTSVMSTSPAEQIGILKGDMILSYNDKKIFSWGEIRQATTKGLRGEPVNIVILRDGDVINMAVPRGPLGVMMHPARDEPVNESLY